MDYKKLGKIAGISAICIAAVIFLYGRMQVDYGEYEGKEEKATSQEGVQEKITEFPRRYQKKVDEKLKFDVEVVCDEGIAEKGIPKANASVVSLNQQSLYEYFMGESGNVQKEIIDNYADIDGTTGILTSYTDDKGSELWVADKESVYGEALTDYIYNSFCVDKNADEYNAEKYSKTSDLSFMSRTKAWDVLKDSMEKMNIDLSNARENAVYSLDAATLQEEESCIDVEGNVVEEEKKPDWSEDDEGYYYFLGQQVEGVPLYEEYTVGRGEGMELETSPLKIYQTANGISYFNISRWFSIQEQEERYKLAPFEEIMNVLEEKYTGTVKTNPLTVKKAVLYEYPINMEDNTYTLIPVWICSLAEEIPDMEGGTYTSYFRVPINAITGEEMPELEE